MLSFCSKSSVDSHLTLNQNQCFHNNSRTHVMWPLVIYHSYVISPSPCFLFPSCSSILTTLKSLKHAHLRAFAIPSAWSVPPSTIMTALLYGGPYSNTNFSGSLSTVILAKTTFSFLHFSALFYFWAANDTRHLCYLNCLFPVYSDRTQAQ